MAPCKKVVLSHWSDSCSKIALISPLFQFLYDFICHWFLNVTLKTAVQENYPNSEFVRIPFQSVVSEKFVDEREVEKSYQWLSKSLKEGNENEIRYRCINLALELQNLANQKSNGFLKALVERVFPTDGTDETTAKIKTFDICAKDDGFFAGHEKAEKLLQKYNITTEDSVSFKKAVKSTPPVHDLLPSNTSSIQLDALSKELELLGLCGQDKDGSDTNVQGQDSTSSDQSFSGITMTFCPSDSGGWIGNGGSDGDGNEPNKTDTRISNEHYVETAVSPLEQVAGCEKAEKPGSDTNVQGQESTSSDQNPSGITTTFCPSDSGGGIGNGGSDGDGDGIEPNNTDTSISNGHYVETPVSPLEQVAGYEKAEKPGSDTNVQGQESTSSDQNPSGITTTFCPSDSDGGIGNGGSDGDGNEPNNTDTSISNEHYVETPVSPLEQDTSNCVGTGLVEIPELPDTIGNHMLTSGNNENAGNVTSDDFSQNASTMEDSVAHDRNSSIANSTLGTTASEPPLNQHSSDQAYDPNLGSKDLPKPQPLEDGSSKAVLCLLLNQKVLNVKEERYYEENDDYRSCGIIERETHGQYDVCQDNVTGGYFVRKKVRKCNFNKNELQVWQKLCGPSVTNRCNIVELYGAIEDNESVTMLMEHMSGTFADIAAMHEFVPLSEKEVLSLVKPVLHGLDLIHDKELVHRNINCTSLYYDENTFEVKIGGFDQSHELNNELFLQHCIPRSASVRNMPYELVCRDETYGRSLDVWSVACGITHLMTGCLPWSDCETEEQIVQKILARNSPEIPPCSPTMNEVLRKMFHPDKKERPTVKELLQDRIFAIEPDSSLDEVRENLFYRILDYRLYQHGSLSYQADDPMPIVEQANMSKGCCSPMTLDEPDEEENPG